MLSACAPAALGAALQGAGWTGSLANSGNLVCGASCNGATCQ
jgi:hypothetical protein